MPRVASQYAFHPQLSYRYMIVSSRLIGAAIYAKGAEQPSISSNPVQVDYGPSYMKIVGRPTWNDITLTCYQFEGITIREAYLYFDLFHMKQNTAKVEYPDTYKHLMIIFLLNAQGVVPIGQWFLHGAFISEMSGGNMGYDTNDVMELSITVTYDHAEFV